MPAAGEPITSNCMLGVGVGVWVVVGVMGVKGFGAH